MRRLFSDWLINAGIDLEATYRATEGWSIELDARVFPASIHAVDSPGMAVFGCGQTPRLALEDLLVKLSGKTIVTIPYMDTPAREFVFPGDVILGELGLDHRQGGML